jgi:hypothetical protein
MKLITEHTEDVKPLIEAREDGKKSYFIEGIMLQAETVNRNGRMYPLSILSEEIGRYNTNYIVKNRAMGELNHPTSPTVNLDKVCHMITEMKKSGNDFIGKAKILTETPMGAIVKNLIDEGACLGVSSRGMGSLQKINGVNIVQKDFTLSAIDIVADPSAPGAFVNGIMEGKEWIWDNGILKEQQISEYHNQLKKTPKRKLERVALELFENFLRRL